MAEVEQADDFDDEVDETESDGVKQEDDNDGNQSAMDDEERPNENMSLSDDQRALNDIGKAMTKDVLKLNELLTALNAIQSYDDDAGEIELSQNKILAPFVKTVKNKNRKGNIISHIMNDQKEKTQIIL